MSRIWAYVSAALLALAVLTGCNGSAPSAPDTDVATSTPSFVYLPCEGNDCGADDKEITTTPCHAAAADVSEVKDTQEVDVSGKVSIRKSVVNSSDPNVNALCDRVYWAKLAQTEVNGQPYHLALKATDSQGRVRVVEQRSDNPKLEALTRTIKARPGYQMEACVSQLHSSVLVCVTALVV